jgi:hypothetical protein
MSHGDYIRVANSMVPNVSLSKFEYNCISFSIKNPLILISQVFHSFMLFMFSKSNDLIWCLLFSILVWHYFYAKVKLKTLSKYIDLCALHNHPIYDNMETCLFIQFHIQPRNNKKFWICNIDSFFMLHLHLVIKK